MQKIRKLYLYDHKNAMNLLNCLALETVLFYCRIIQNTSKEIAFLYTMCINFKIEEVIQKKNFKLIWL